MSKICPFKPKIIQSNVQSKLHLNCDVKDYIQMLKLDEEMKKLKLKQVQEDLVET